MGVSLTPLHEAKRARRWAGGASGRNPLRVGTIGGAALLSLGVVTLGIILKERLKWKRELRKYREE